MLEVINDVKEVKANKEHRCSWCGSTIKKGEKYKTSTLKYDDIYTWRECHRCEKYVKEMMVEWESFDEGYTEEDFHYFMDEKYGENYERLLGGN